MPAMQRRLEANGIAAFGPLDHDFVRSIYMYDPNGIQVEIWGMSP
jgi:catechol-2,3-dioxygenase